MKIIRPSHMLKSDNWNIRNYYKTLVRKFRKNLNRKPVRRDKVALGNFGAIMRVIAGGSYNAEGGGPRTRMGDTLDDKQRAKGVID
jgi:hypothetical protein